VPSPRSDDSVNQYLIRRADAAGGEEVSGWATTQLYAGQRTAMLHVAFCPPFASSPTVDVRQTAGPIARVRAAQVLPWGARIEVKLPQAADSPCQARIEFRASCPPANKSGN
jgi:hypothetical protein